MFIHFKLLVTACLSVVTFLSFASASNAKDILPRRGGETILPWHSSPHPPALAEARDGQLVSRADTRAFDASGLSF